MELHLSSQMSLWRKSSRHRSRGQKALSCRAHKPTFKVPVGICVLWYFPCSGYATVEHALHVVTPCMCTPDAFSVCRETSTQGLCPILYHWATRSGLHSSLSPEKHLQGLIKEIHNSRLAVQRYDTSFHNGFKFLQGSGKLAWPDSDSETRASLKQDPIHCIWIQPPFSVEVTYQRADLLPGLPNLHLRF